jgi:hypothetical protein
LEKDGRIVELLNEPVEDLLSLVWIVVDPEYVVVDGLGHLFGRVYLLELVDGKGITVSPFDVGISFHLILLYFCYSELGKWF